MKGALRSRVASYPVTSTFLALVSAWFILELWVLPVPRSWIQYWFAMQSSLPTSPGWVTSLITHTSIQHYVVNVILLMIFGRWVEQSLDWRSYVGFILVTGYGANVAQATAASSSGGEVAVAGASGVGYAAMTFVPLVYFTIGDSRLPGDSWRRIWNTGGTREDTVSVMLGLAFLIAFLYPVLELTPLVEAGKSGTVGHLAAAFLGVLIFLIYRLSACDLKRSVLPSV